MRDAGGVTFTAGEDGIGWLTFRAQARPTVLDHATRAALAAVLDAAERARVRAVVIRGESPRIFIAGADLRELTSLGGAEAAAAFAREGQGLFQRIAAAAVPFLCAIDGACAGGGFELALACHWRIATPAAATRIGLPETSLGTIPGWGGSVRLARLIGTSAALEHILAGQLIDAGQAQAAGMIHEVVPASELREHARTRALALAPEGPPVRPPPPAIPEARLEELRKLASARGRHNPALAAAVETVVECAGLPLPAALELEAVRFGGLTASAVCRNSIHAFFLREGAKKRGLDGWFPGTPAKGASAPTSAPAPIRKVGVVGAGVMGSGIAHWCALQECDVVLRDVSPEILTRGLEVVRALLDAAVTRGRLVAGEANRALQRIVTTSEWTGFADCDLVIEAIVENTAAKRELFAELAAQVGAETIVASNTSALPIEEIAGHLPHPARVLGIHFFNPVSRMALVELVLGEHTGRDVAERTLRWLKELRKAPVVCRSSPGFLVTRVLFFYLNAAVARWESGVPARDIDAALTAFGWPMGPLRLIDEVGIDVSESIFGELAHYFPTRFRRTSACARLLAAGLKGRKNGASRGFYRYEDQETPNEAETRRVWLERSLAPTPNVSPDDLVRDLMRVMVDEAERCLAEGVIKSAEDVDFALLSGAGFPAFRGGLLHWARGAKNGVTPLDDSEH